MTAPEPPGEPERCPECGGEGTIAGFDRCHVCRGSGRAAPPLGERTEECSAPIRLAEHRAEHGPGSVQAKGDYLDGWRAYADDAHGYLTMIERGYRFRLVHPEPPAPAPLPPGEPEVEAGTAGNAIDRRAAPLPPGDDEPRRLVERLRAVNRVYPIAAVGEAADYIERLTAAPVPPPGGDEPRRSDLVGRLLDSLDAILDETLPTGDPAVDVDLAHLRVTELRVLLRDAPAPVLPPGVTLCRAADGTEFMVALGRDVPEGWGWSDDDGTEGWVTADGPVEAMPVTALRVRPPEPPSAPRTERVPWSETVGRRLPDGRQVYTAQHFEGEKPYIMTKGIPEAARHAVAPDGTVEVLALEPSDADQGEGS